MEPSDESNFDHRRQQDKDESLKFNTSQSTGRIEATTMMMAAEMGGSARGGGTSATTTRLTQWMRGEPDTRVVSLVQNIRRDVEGQSRNDQAQEEHVVNKDRMQNSERIIEQRPTRQHACSTSSADITSTTTNTTITENNTSRVVAPVMEFHPHDFKDRYHDTELLQQKNHQQQHHQQLQEQVQQQNELKEQPMPGALALSPRPMLPPQTQQQEQPARRTESKRNTEFTIARETNSSLTTEVNNTTDQSDMCLPTPPLSSAASESGKQNDNSSSSNNNDDDAVRSDLTNNNPHQIERLISKKRPLPDEGDEGLDDTGNKRSKLQKTETSDISTTTTTTTAAAVKAIKGELEDETEKRLHSDQVDFSVAQEGTTSTLESTAVPSVAIPSRPSTDGTENANTKTNSRKASTSSMTTGRWTHAEHEAFLEGLRECGREWKKVALKIPTRSSAQIRSHAQKYFAKLAREQAAAAAAAAAVTMTTTTTTTNAFSPIDSSPAVLYNNLSPSASASLHIGPDGSLVPSSSLANYIGPTAKRILTDPQGTQQEVEDTLEALRKRYRQLQRRLERRRHRRQHRHGRQHQQQKDCQVNTGGAQIKAPLEGMKGRSNYNAVSKNTGGNNNSNNPMTSPPTPSSPALSSVRKPFHGGCDESSSLSSLASSRRELGNEEIIALQVLGGDLPRADSSNGSGGDGDKKGQRNPSAEDASVHSSSSLHDNTRRGMEQHFHSLTVPAVVAVIPHPEQEKTELATSEINHFKSNSLRTNANDNEERTKHINS